jgi:hypothetical protein
MAKRSHNGCANPEDFGIVDPLTGDIGNPFRAVESHWKWLGHFGIIVLAMKHYFPS